MFGICGKCSIKFLKSTPLASYIISFDTKSQYDIFTVIEPKGNN